MNKEQIQFNEDHLWLAFQYVAGELSDADVEAFELQMLDDQRLCEAVVEASLLTTAVASTKQPAAVTVVVPAIAAESRSAQIGRGTSAAIASIVAVCCCLAIVVLTARFSATDSEGDVVAASDLAETQEVEVLVDVWADGISEGVDMEPLESDVFDRDLDVPSWLMAAVSLDANQAASAEHATDGTLQDDMELF